MEGSKETSRSPSKKDTETKETLSSDTQLGDSKELSRSPSKKGGWNKRGFEHTDIPERQ
jgi:hypothetical protein